MVQLVLQGEQVAIPADEHRHACGQGKIEKHLILRVTNLVLTRLDGARTRFTPRKNILQQLIDIGPREPKPGVGEHPKQFASGGFRQHRLDRPCLPAAT